MVDSVTIVVEAVKFGYKRYGPKGAVAAAVAVGASYALIVKVVPRYTSVDEEQVEEMYGKISDDSEVGEMLGEEFFDRFEEYFDSDSDRAAGTAATD